MLCFIISDEPEKAALKAYFQYLQPEAIYPLQILLIIVSDSAEKTFFVCFI